MVMEGPMISLCERLSVAGVTVTRPEDSCARASHPWPEPGRNPCPSSEEGTTPSRIPSHLHASPWGVGESARVIADHLLLGEDASLHCPRAPVGPCKRLVPRVPNTRRWAVLSGAAHRIAFCPPLSHTTTGSFDSADLMWLRTIAYERGVG